MNKLSHKDFINKVKLILGNDYLVLSEYINSKSNIVIKHFVCNKEYITKSYNVLSGCKCPHCYTTNKKTTEEFKQEVFKQVNNEYEVLSEYKNALLKIEMKHNVCGQIFLVRPNDFLSKNKSRCPHCKKSKGETKILSYLKKNNINYEYQYKFLDCKNQRQLPFDFAIFNSDKSLNCLIEYDGELHYKQSRFKNNEYSKNKLKKTKNNDLIKNKYCEKNNIKLIRINYLEFNNIEIFLKKQLIIF